MGGSILSFWLKYGIYLRTIWHELPTSVSSRHDGYTYVIYVYTDFNNGKAIGFSYCIDTLYVIYVCFG